MKKFLAVAFTLAACHSTPHSTPHSTIPASPPAPNQRDTSAPAPTPAAACVELPASTQTALMTVTAPSRKPTLDEAAQQLGLAADALDCTFGVVMISPQKGIYSVRVDATKVKGAWTSHGPYSDPKIEPMR